MQYSNSKLRGHECQVLVKIFFSLRPLYLSEITTHLRNKFLVSQPVSLAIYVRLYV